MMAASIERFDDFPRNLFDCGGSVDHTECLELGEYPLGSVHIASRPSSFDDLADSGQVKSQYKRIDLTLLKVWQSTLQYGFASHLRDWVNFLSLRSARTQHQRHHTHSKHITESLSSISTTLRDTTEGGQG